MQDLHSYNALISKLPTSLEHFLIIAFSQICKVYNYYICHGPCTQKRVEVCVFLSSFFGKLHQHALIQGLHLKVCTKPVPTYNWPGLNATHKSVQLWLGQGDPFFPKNQWELRKFALFCKAMGPFLPQNKWQLHKFAPFCKDNMVSLNYKWFTAKT